MNDDIGSRKKAVFTIMMIGLVIAIPALAVLGYYGYKKLTFSYDYCGSYGEFDGELGWHLKANATSCLSLKNKVTGKVFFDSKIYTNKMGFRDARPGLDVRTGNIVTVGDSWTFGYGVNYEQTYPYFLSTLSGIPVTNLGVPAYGSGNTLLLFKRNAHQLKPRVVIYLSRGLWDRSICTEKNKENTLTPCFLASGDNSVKLVTPRPGLVEESVRRHDYPGGSLTAGYDSFWTYFFIVKPKELLGLTHKLPADSAEPAVLARIFTYELGSYLDVAKQENFTFVLVDPSNYYRSVAENLNEKNFIYISGKEDWQNNVEKKISELPYEQAYVPGDGHYGEKSNKLIAQEIYRILQARGVLK